MLLTKPVVVIGASSFGRLVRVLVSDAGRVFAGYLDDFSSGEDIIGSLDRLREPGFANEVDLALAIGYRHLEARREIFHRALGQGFQLPALVHPRAYVSKEATLGPGCLVMAGANVDAFADVGGACVLWPGSIVSHDARVGENTFVSPNATICGFTRVGHSSFLGAGCTLVNNLDLPPSSFVKAAQRISQGRT